MAEVMDDYSRVSTTDDCSNCTFYNTTDINYAADYIFNRFEAKVILGIFYTIVFCCCFFGNTLVILIVLSQRRMRTITNFFLTNLAGADLCVGLFCVYQNMSLYLTTDWIFGDFMCRMYHFVHSLSYTGSIAILVMISVERYVAIVYPMLSKQVMTMGRMKIAGLTVWLISAVYCSPRLVMYGLIEIPSASGKNETLCILKRSFYDSKTYDLINFIVCFLIPLSIISVLYFIICLRLWRSNQVSKHYTSTTFTARTAIATRARAHSSPSQPEEMYHMSRLSSYEIQDASSANNTNRNNLKPSDVIVHDSQYSMTIKRNNRSNNELYPPISCRGPKNHVLNSRKKVIRLLVSVVFSFAFCHLPFHARKLWQNWSPNYDGTSNASIILTITTTLILYMNSGINPFLYAILSENFRTCMVDVLLCKFARLRKSRAQNRSLIRNEMNSFTVRSISISQDEERK